MRAFFGFPMIFLVTLVPNCGPDFPCETNPPDELPPVLDYVVGFPTGTVCGDFTVTGYIQDETQTDDRPSGLRRIWLTLDGIEIESLEIRMGCPEGYDFSFVNVQLPEMGILELHAEDCEGNSAALKAALITDVFDEDPPSVDFLSPTEDEEFPGGSIVFEVTIESDDEDVEVLLVVDGMGIGLDDSSPYRWIVDDLGPGNHLGEAQAEDTCGNIGETQVEFTVTR